MTASIQNTKDIGRDEDASEESKLRERDVSNVTETTLKQFAE